MITGSSEKSIFLKVTECLLLVKYYVVPATNMELHDLNRLIHLNDSDCQGKESPFQAEMERCYQINSDY